MHRGDKKNGTDDPTANRSPEKYTGYCNSTCADAYWAKWELKQGKGPTCGVPGCERPADDDADTAADATTWHAGATATATG